MTSDLVYGVDVGVRRIAIAGPDYLLAVLSLANPPIGTHRVRSKDEVRALAVFFQALQIPSQATIWVEQPVSKHGRGANIGTAIRLGMTIGGLFAVHDGPGYIVDQATWKAELLANGHADKPAIKAWLAREDPASAEACGEDQDLTDACCIRRYGVLVAEGKLEGPGPVHSGRPIRRRALRAGERAADVPPAVA